MTLVMTIDVTVVKAIDVTVVKAIDVTVVMTIDVTVVKTMITTLVMTKVMLDLNTTTRQCFTRAGHTGSRGKHCALRRLLEL